MDKVTIIPFSASEATLAYARYEFREFLFSVGCPEQDVDRIVDENYPKPSPAARPTPRVMGRDQV